MGKSIICQWTWSNNERTAPLNEYILTRILEHYGLSQPARLTIQFRTYKATFDSVITRQLTTINYSQSFPPTFRGQSMIPRDDVTFVFMDEPESNPPSDTALPQRPQEETSTLDDDGFEIVNKQDEAEGKKQRFRTLTVRPSRSVIPLLQNLLSPFVLGLTKSARAAASTTAETARPAPLTGTPLVLTSFIFPVPNPPHPPIILTVHNLPSSTASSIFLEAELTTSETSLEDLESFLEGCLPEVRKGDVRFFNWQPDDGKEGECSGIEGDRRTAHLLAKTLRNSGFI